MTDLLSVTANNEEFLIDVGNAKRATVTFDNVSTEFVKGAFWYTMIYSETRINMLHVPRKGHSLIMPYDLFRDNFLGTIHEDSNIVNKEFTNTYNKQFKDYFSHKYPDRKRYILVVEIDNDIELFHFDDMDFLNGFQTLYKTVALDDTLISINSIHDNDQLCYRYIKHDVKVLDLTPIRDVILDMLVKDVIGIILEYYPDTCKYYEELLKDPKTNKVVRKSIRYTHCDTLCEIGQQFCEICKHYRNGESSKMFKSSVRLEPVI